MITAVQLGCYKVLLWWFLNFGTVFCFHKSGEKNGLGRHMDSTHPVNVFTCHVILFLPLITFYF